MEPDQSKNYEASIPVYGYTVLKPGSSRVSVSIRNLSCRKITVLAKSAIAKVIAANIVPHSYAPNVDNNEQLQQEFENYQQQHDETILDETTPETVLTPPTLIPERESLLFSKINLDGANEWSEELKAKMKDLF